MKIGKGMVDLEQLVKLDQSREYRVYQTEMGAEPGKKQLVVGRAVPWKGMNKEQLMHYRTANGKSIWDNLQQAIRISKETAGAYGMAVLEYPDGSLKNVPYHAAVMAVRRHPAYFKIKTTTPGKKPWIHGTPPAAAVSAAGAP